MTPEPDSCPADRLAQRKARAGRDRGREQRMAVLEAFTFAFTVACGVFFTGVFVRGLAHVDALRWAALGAAFGAAFVGAVRAFLPADVDRGPPEPEDDTEDEGGWDVGNAVLAAIVIPVVFVVELLVRQWSLLLVVAALSLGATSISAWGIVAAVGCSLVVLAVLEVGVVWPLARRWDLPFD